MPDRTTWERSPHTGVKHQILRSYLGAWYGKLAWTRRLVFIDGFAGPGGYDGGEEGSPLIALRMAIDHKAFQPGSKTENCDRVLAFIEADPARYTQLLLELEKIALPEHVKVLTYNVEFEEGFTAILDGAQRRLAPAFVMIDPFGWTGFPFSLVERLGQEDRSEVMVSFMIESVTRWISHPQQEANWDRLFGSGEWRQMPANGTPDERRQFLIGLYERRLREAGFVYQWRFELRDEGNRSEYYLMYGSKSREGLAAMKEAMWKVAPDGSFRYSDYQQGGGQMRLFLGDADPRVLGGLLTARFAGAGETTKATLLEFTLTETDFLAKHLNASLRVLEDNGATIRRPEGRRKAYLDQVWVTFS